MSSRFEELYDVVDYQHIDDFRCFQPLESALEENYTRNDSPEFKQRLQELKNWLGRLFSNAGWEGDGEINCFYIPPCFGSQADFGGTSCYTIFHVKQSNNGTSWLAIPKSFRFKMPEGLLSPRS